MARLKVNPRCNTSNNPRKKESRAAVAVSKAVWQHCAVVSSVRRDASAVPIAANVVSRCVKVAPV